MAMAVMMAVAMAVMMTVTVAQVIYLDEPTTGMDPINRRHVWDVIEKAKQSHTVVLTTHSMEEADILGDTIGIMAKGRLRCLGGPVHLKSRFGAGYRLMLTLSASADRDKIKGIVSAAVNVCARPYDSCLHDLVCTSVVAITRTHFHIQASTRSRSLSHTRTR